MGWFLQELDLCLLSLGGIEPGARGVGWGLQWEQPALPEFVHERCTSLPLPNNGNLVNPTDLDI